jgi:hypothetical protein
MRGRGTGVGEVAVAAEVIDGGAREPDDGRRVSMERTFGRPRLDARIRTC